MGFLSWFQWIISFAYFILLPRSPTLPNPPIGPSLTPKTSTVRLPKPVKSLPKPITNNNTELNVKKKKTKQTKEKEIIEESAEEFFKPLLERLDTTKKEIVPIVYKPKKTQVEGADDENKKERKKKEKPEEKKKSPRSFYKSGIRDPIPMPNRIERSTLASTNARSTPVRSQSSAQPRVKKYVYVPPLPAAPPIPPPETNLDSKIIQRLLRDLKEIQEDPLSTVSAHPLEGNILVWHGNLKPNSGPYAGVTFHLQLTFPKTYPSDPPTLFLFTPFPHPNVFGGYVCIDMLRPYLKSERYKGWSTAYSVQSCLLQLQAFLTAENIHQDYGDAKQQIVEVETVDAAKDVIDSFVCKGCGHSYDNPFPPLPDQDDTFGGDEMPANSLLPPRLDRGNVLNPKAASRNVTISEDGMTIKAEMETGWWGARSFKGYEIGGSFSSYCCYFEVLINGRGVSRVGFSLRGAKYNLGTDDKGWGYGGTGKKSHNNVFTDFGRGYRKNDIIGCALNLSNGEIVYFKNGKCMGVAFTIPKELHKNLFYPTIAIRNMEVKVNFGAEGFRYYPPQFQAFRRVRPDPNLEIFAENSSRKEVVMEEKPHPASFPVGKNNYFNKLDVNVIGVIRKQFLLEKLELRCFHTKFSFTEAILGLGISKNISQNIYSCCPDIISYDAYKAGVRLTAWKDKFQYFLPLIIGHGYPKRKEVIQILQNSIKEILGISLESIFDPIRASEFLVKAMLGTISTIASSKSHVEQFISDSSYVSYCALHHMLLTIAELFPEVQKERVLREVFTQKEVLENLIYLTICDVKWKEVSDKLIGAYILKTDLKSKVMGLKDLDEKFLLQESFTLVAAEMKELLYHIFFLTYQGKPEDKNPSQVLEMYNISFGRPSYRHMNELSAIGKKLSSLNSWKKFFEEAGCDNSTKWSMMNLIKNGRFV